MATARLGGEGVLWEVGNRRLEVGTMAFGNGVVKDVGAELVQKGECDGVWDKECMVNGGCETLRMRIDWARKRTVVDGL